MTTTTNYGWTKPTVGGDDDTWGTELNATLDSIDTQVHSLDTARVLAQGSAAAAASVDITVPSGYRSLRLILNSVLTSAGAVLWLRFNLGSGVVSSGYNYFLMNWQSSSAGFTDTKASGQSQIVLTDSQGINATSGSGYFDLSIQSEGTSGTSVLPSILGKGTYNSGAGGGAWGAADIWGQCVTSMTPITALRVLPASGTVTLRYTLLGVPNS